MGFPQEVRLSFGQEKRVTSGQEYPLGTPARLPDGSTFRYAFSGEAIGAGQVVMQKAGIANHDMDLSIAAAVAVGDRTISITVPGTNATADQYQDGTLYVNDGAGEGHTYRLRSKGPPTGSAHAAVTAGNNGTFTLADDETFQEALVVATTLVGLMENPYKDVEIWDADDIDGPCLGVAPTEVANDRYFWCRESGDQATLIDATTVVLGSAVEPSSTVDGAVTLHDVSANTDRQAVGVVQHIVAVSTDYGMVKWNLK